MALSMPTLEQSVSDHYGLGNLVEVMLANLRNGGVDVEQLTREDLVPFEEFHGGGRGATRQLAEIANIDPND